MFKEIFMALRPLIPGLIRAIVDHLTSKGTLLAVGAALTDGRRTGTRP